MKNIFAKLWDKKARSRTISYLLVIGFYLVMQIMSLTGNMSNMLQNLLIPVCCYIVAALALNLTVGISGELSLGQAGFMSIGAFTAVCVSGALQNSITAEPVRLVIAIVIGAAFAALCGFLIGIPVLKLQGDYLAIVTLAFGQIIVNILNNVYLGVDSNGFQFSFIENKLKLAEGGKALISGAMGATGTKKISTFTAGIILILITLVIIYHLMYSRNGRAIMAARDNRIAAESVGINIFRTKMLAFVVSSMLAGAAGALFALNYATLLPAKFNFNTSILILVYVVLGGLGNMTGTLISTTLLVVLPEMLRGLQDYRMLIYAVILIAIMLITNNETLKLGFEKFLAKFKKKGAEKA